MKFQCRRTSPIALGLEREHRFQVFHIFQKLYKKYKQIPPKIIKNQCKSHPKASENHARNNVRKKIVKILQKTCPGTPQGSKMGAQIAPRRPQKGAKIHQNSNFWASGTPQLQPTCPRDAQEGVNHPNWTQKSSKIDPKTMKSSLR